MVDEAGRLEQHDVGREVAREHHAPRREGEVEDASSDRVHHVGHHHEQRKHEEARRHPNGELEADGGGEEGRGHEEAGEVRQEEGNVGGAEDERPPHGVHQPRAQRIRPAVGQPCRLAVDGVGLGFGGGSEEHEDRADERTALPHVEERREEDEHMQGRLQLRISSLEGGGDAVAAGDGHVAEEGDERDEDHQVDPPAREEDEEQRAALEDGGQRHERVALGVLMKMKVMRVVVVVANSRGV